MQETILPDLEAIKKNNDNSLSEKDFKKISFYYGLAVPVIGEVYCVLRGEKMSQIERRTLTYLGGATGLFDDIFDDKNASESHIKNLLNSPKPEQGKNTHELLLIQFYQKALEESNSTLINKYANEVYNAQVLSKKQTSANITTEEISKITQLKGSASILFYRVALETDISTIEKDLLIKIGLLGQLENDIFDIYNDREDGISTLATTATSMTALRQRFSSILDEVYTLIDQTPFPKRNKKKFSRLIALLGTRGLVCLDQLMELEEEGKFKIAKHDRKQLVCDMGKYRNNWRWIRAYLRWNDGQ